MKISIVGCGRISHKYMTHLSGFPQIEVSSCFDVNEEKASSISRAFNVPIASSLDESIQDPTVDVVVNLTPPIVHSEISEAGFDSKKHVYTEKPLDVSRESALRLIDLAGRTDLRFASAPCQFLGTALQTARRVIDSGKIGRPTAATASVMNHGHEATNPEPQQYYRASGGGPLFNRAPYYIGALSWLLGSVEYVIGMGNQGNPDRTIGVGPQKGMVLRAKVNTHEAGLIRFSSGVVASLVTSFDVWKTEVPALEVYGTEGTLSLPDPTKYNAPLRVSSQSGAWEDIPVPVRPTDGEAAGLIELAEAIKDGRRHRCGADFAYHILDAMLAIQESSSNRLGVTVASTYRRPELIDGGA
ncbi:Gfo/Idh/MocA family protein [Streptomyces pseudovenezuelae]|uniref:Gfo/Idh/MocA family protein n=1 Tax=Streptomyces pseudovenezuelae TaxID=67350 RepID=UPI003712B497